MEKLLAHRHPGQGQRSVHHRRQQARPRHKGGHAATLDTKVLDNDDTTALMKSITPDRCQQELQEKGGADFAIEFTDGVRFRVAVFKQRGNIGMVLRRIPSAVPVLRADRHARGDQRLITRPRGLLLVTGPTGSGKTTSLASMINFLNHNYDKHIITLEDPIEYFHKHKKCTGQPARDRRRRADFKEGIRRALRMAPDIILVGEMRDLETIHAAIEAAETGHVVFGTLHTNSASSTVNRIIDVFPKDQQDQIRTQLATALIGVLSQTLLPKKPEGVVAAYEMMVVTPAIPNLIRENKTYRIDSSHPDRRARTACSCWTRACSGCGRTAWSKRKKCLLKAAEAGRAGRPHSRRRTRRAGRRRRR